MKNLKILFCLFFLLSIGSTNVWGVVNEGDEYSWNSSTKTLTIHKAGDYADGIMDDCGTTDQPWRLKTSGSAEHIVVEDGITTIGTFAFYGCCDKVSDVTLPSSLTTIKQGAFGLCTIIANVYFKGSPSEWASIDFQSNDAYRRSHPFYANVNKSPQGTSNRKFYFYGNSSPSNAIALEPGITEVKPYAFYGATGITGINIPGSVTTIGTNAFNVSSYSDAWIAINKKTAPTTVGASAFKTGVTLYVPTGSTGYGSTWNGLTVNNANVSGKIQEGDNKVSWNLSENGVLTLDATESTTKNLSISNAGKDLPWARFRRLVYKVKMKGEIAGIGNLLKYIYGNSEIILDQDAIPTINANGIATTGSTSYAELFNKRDQLKLTIKLASLTHSTTSNLASAPLSDIKSGTTKWWQVGLSERVNIEDNNDNTETLLSNCSTYVEKPFDLQLKRSLSNEYYNTFCSSVSMTEEEVTAMFGAETELVEFDGTEIIDGVLNLKFKDASSITAGTPYLIQPAVAVSNPTFTNVNPASIATSGSIVSGTHADFYGTLAPVEVSPGQIEGKNLIFLLANNKLTYATGGTLKGMRAYFLLKEGTPSSVMAKRPVLQIGNGENTTTDLGQVPSDKIQCTKVLRDGQIYILRGEKAYNLQGIEIDRPNKL